MTENFTPTPEHNDWYVPETEPAQEAVKFDIDALYTPEEFIKLVRAQMDMCDAHRGEDPYDSILVTLEVWERRVLDILEIGYLVGFVTGEDHITRIYFTLPLDEAE